MPLFLQPLFQFNLSLINTLLILADPLFQPLFLDFPLFQTLFLQILLNFNFYPLFSRCLNSLCYRSDSSYFSHHSLRLPSNFLIKCILYSQPLCPDYFCFNLTFQCVACSNPSHSIQPRENHVFIGFSRKMIFETNGTSQI